MMTRAGSLKKTQLPIEGAGLFRAEHLWAALDQLASEHGLTSSALARKAGLDSTTFNRSKRFFRGRDRWPATSSIAKVLEATGESFVQFAVRVTELQKLPQEPSQPDFSARKADASRGDDLRRV